MAITDFQYATVSDLRKFAPQVLGVGFNNKIAVRNWQTTTTSNLYETFGTGDVSMLYFNGQEGTSTSSEPTSDGQFRHTSATDKLEYYNADHHPNDILMEIGEDNNAFIDTVLEQSSQLLNSMLDGRFAIPIPKQFYYDESTPDWDIIIKKIVCYISAVDIMRSDNPLSEEADKLELTYMDLVNRINTGEIKLRVEIDNTDKNGEIIVNSSNSGALYLVESYCEQWQGKLYDKVKLTCTTAGAYGVAKIKVETFGNSKIQGSETMSDVFVEGSLQHVGNGLYVRFEGGDMAVDDYWEIAIKRNDLDESNSQVKDIPIFRGRREVYR